MGTSIYKQLLYYQILVLFISKHRIMIIASNHMQNISIKYFIIKVNLYFRRILLQLVQNLAIYCVGKTLYLNTSNLNYFFNHK